MLRAWADESGSVPDADPGAFLFGAALVLDDHLDDIRDVMTSLRRPSEKKIHWRDDSAKRRTTVIEAIAGLPLVTLVVVRVGPTSEPAERRRRKCFEVFVPEVHAAGCTELTLESRGSHLDRRDMEMLAALRSRRLVPGTVRLNHRPGPAEPALWIADAVCGAYVAARVRGEGYLDEIRARTRIVEVQT